MSCEIVDKETGDRVNLAAGIVFWVGFAGLFICAGLRGCQEFKKHFHKNHTEPVQVMNTQKMR